MRSIGIAALGIACVALGVGGCEPSARAGAESSERARAHVEKRCTGCHPGAKLDDVVRKRNATGDSALDDFLKGHHVADAELRAEVVAYLKARLAN